MEGGEKVSDTPYFITIGGCENCEVFKYGTGGTSMLSCALRNCLTYGHSIENPTIGAKEYTKRRREKPSGSSAVLKAV